MQTHGNTYHGHWPSTQLPAGEILIDDAFIERYYYPMKRRVVWKFHLDSYTADDLVQDFTVKKLLSERVLQKFDRTHRFRNFLLTVLDNFAKNWLRSDNAKHVAPMNTHMVSILPARGDDDSIKRQYRDAVIKEFLTGMHASCTDKGREDLWGVFKGRVLRPARGEPPISYKELIRHYGFHSAKQAGNALITAKRMARDIVYELLREEVDEGEVESALRDLIATLAMGPIEAHLSWTDLTITNTHSLVALVTKPGEALWPKDEHEVILRHQLDAPLEADFSGDSDLLAAARGCRPPIHSLGDLFTHNDPPLVLLRAAKELAKADTNREDGELPRDVAAMIYYASLAVALHWHGKRISSLGVAEMRSGIEWALRQKWPEERYSVPLRDSLTKLKGSQQR